MMLARSELQQPDFAFDPENSERMIGVLRERIATGNQPHPHRFVHEGDPYSAAPADLVRYLEHVPGTDHGDGKDRCWCFITVATCHESAQGGFTHKRLRTVAVGGAVKGSYKWRTEKKKQPVKDGEGRIVGYMRVLYYGIQISKTTFQRLGWCMVEFGLDEIDSAGQILLCKVYMSNRNTYPQAFTGAPGQDEEGGASLGESLEMLVTRAALPLSMPSRTGGQISAREEENPAIGATVVMAFHGSSIASAQQIKDVANHVLSLTEDRPVIVLSALGNTTTNIQRAAEKALSCGVQHVDYVQELAVIKELYHRTVHELGLPSTTVSGLFNLMEEQLEGIAVAKDLSPPKLDYIVSFGGRMSSTIFCAYLDKLQKNTKLYTAFDVSFTTTDDFTHGDVLEATYVDVAKRLQIHDSTIPVVTSFVRKACKPGVITTLGTDFTAMIIGKALGLEKIEIWKDVNGVLTGDPNICTNAKIVPCLTFEETAELVCSGAQVLDPESMRLAMEGGMPVIILKNSCNPQAPGTVITQTRDMSESILVSIVLKPNIVMLDIVKSTGVTSQRNFQAQVSILQNSGICFDLDATSGGSICFTLHPWKLCGRELTQKEIATVVEELKKVAVVHQRERISMISLIGNAQKSSFILHKALNALDRIGVNAQKVSQMSSNKVMNISLVVLDSEAKHCVQVLHSAFLEDGFMSKVEGPYKERPVPVNSIAAASSPGVKRKADDEHPESPQSARQERAGSDPIGPDETGRTPFSQSYPVPLGDSEGGALGARSFEVEREHHGLAEAAEGGSGPGNAHFLKEMEHNLLSEDYPMQSGDDYGGYWDWWDAGVEGVLPVGGGEPALPESASGAMTEVDAGQGSWTGSGGPEETEHQLSPDNDRMAVGDPQTAFDTWASGI